MSIQPQEVPRHDEDGKPYIGYFDFLTQLYFIWDGKSDHIQVTKGGSSEDVIDTVPVPHHWTTDMYTPLEFFLEWQTLCDGYAQGAMSEFFKRE